VLLVLLAVGIGTWWWRYKHKHSTPATAGKPEMVEEDITVRDEPKAAPVQQAPAENTQPAETAQEAIAPPPTPKHTPQTPKKTPAPRTSGSGKECILIVATLQEKANAERLISTLKNGGYNVYSIQKKGYQVGIQFNYQNLTEVQQKMTELQRLTGENQIWIKKK
jgi:cell division septation protein DedD